MSAWRMFAVGSSFLVLSATHASAQSVSEISGKVTLKAGKSARLIVAPTRAPVGSIVTAAAGSSAVIVYPDGCRQEVTANTTAKVLRSSPCADEALPHTKAASSAGPGGAGAAPGSAGAASGGAGAAAGAGLLSGAGALVAPAVVGVAIVGGGIALASQSNNNSYAARPRGVSP